MQEHDVDRYTAVSIDSLCIAAVATSYHGIRLAPFEHTPQTNFKEPANRVQPSSFDGTGNLNQTRHTQSDSDTALLQRRLATRTPRAVGVPQEAVQAVARRCWGSMRSSRNEAGGTAKCQTMWKPSGSRGKSNDNYGN